MAGNTGGLQWASFNPADFASYDSADANLGFGSITFSTMTFSNVTGVGLLSHSYDADSYAELEVTDFQANLIPEPASATALLGLGVLFMTICRRKRR